MLLTIFKSSAEFRWGPTAGLNVSTISWKQKLTDTHQLAGFQAGVMGELMIPGIGFGIDMAVKYQRQGATVNFGEYKVWQAAGLGNEKMWFDVIEVPIDLRFKWTRMNGFEQYLAPFAYVGPVFRFNCSASKLAGQIEYPGGTVGLQCGIGGEILEHIQISAGYYWGISYCVKTVKLDNYSGRPQGWLLNAAYLF